MGYFRRVTLRCLCEDLKSDWGSVAQQRSFKSLRLAVSSEGPDSDVALALDGVPVIARINHPLVSSFYSSFESQDDDVHRPGISGLSDPQWWQLKTGRWRGAATNAPHEVEEDEVWLCAGGLRAGGDDRDFYASFMKAVESSGPRMFLPSAEDRRLLKVEEKVARRDAWLKQVRLTACITLHDSYASGEPRRLHVPGPAPSLVADPLAHVRFDLVTVGGGDDELVEVILTVSIEDFDRRHLSDLAREAIQSVIEPIVDEWRLLPGPGNDQIWATLVSAEALRLAGLATENGELPKELDGSSLILGVQAHYTAKDGIVGATVEGDSVRGLCGVWFVPTSNPDEVPGCPQCREAYEHMPG